jgi:hypothetical protein
MDMQIYRRDKECVKEERFQYKSGSCTVVIYQLLLFQFVIVVAINIQYVLFSVCTWVNSHRELPTFPKF